MVTLFPSPSHVFHLQYKIISLRRPRPFCHVMRAAAYVTAMLVMHLLSIDAPAALCISLPMLTKQSKDELQHHTHGYNARYYSKFLHREKHMVYMIIFVKCSSYYSLICRYLHICRIHNLLILLQHLYSSYKCKDPTGLT